MTIQGIAMQRPVLSSLAVKSITPHSANGNEQLFALHLERPDWSDFKPGQFAMLRPADWGQDMIWARPLSICSLTQDDLMFFFQIAGRGTKRMSALKPGNLVNIWGPLGTGFALEPDSPTLIIAGGIGLAPFVGYAAAHPRPENLRLLFGHRLPASCYPLDKFNPDLQLFDYPERSSADRDLFLTAAQNNLREIASANGLALACGPAPLLKALRNLALDCGARLEISLEYRMACGVGACLGCVVMPTESFPGANSQPQRSCVNGPVFRADQIMPD
jgi:dihydroorotate dehydrogenase electron transfer subunit